MAEPEIKYRNLNGFPPTICIQLLNWCNLTCVNCRSDSSPHRNEKIEVTTLKTILSQLKEFGIWRISLTGGEPFYYPDLQDLISHINSLNFPFSITTNGFSTKVNFDKIESSHWENGTLYVSIDGDNELHNSLRGANSFEKAMDFLTYSRPKVKKLFVNTVLFSSPLDWARDLYWKLEAIGVDNWTIISPVKKGRFANWQHDEPFETYYNFIKAISCGKTTTSFLDFAKKDNQLEDVVFIDSDATIKLPGYIDGTLIENRLQKK